jgi:quercetin dioxygenase-like cupin family protein
MINLKECLDILSFNQSRLLWARKASSFTLFLMFVFLGTSASSLSASGPEWVPVYKEPKHRLALENDQAFILDVRLPPGYVSLYHEHKIDLLYVHIMGTRVWAENLGGSRREADVKTGDLRFSSDNHPLPQIHRVGVLGSRAFHVIGVGIKSEISNDVVSLEGDTRGMKPSLEKAHASVYSIKLNPGEKTGIHQHNLPFAAVHLSGGKLIVDSGEAVDIEAGEFTWHESSEGHQFENAGNEAVEIIEVLWR